jgi:hypothetical protein
MHHTIVGVLSRNLGHRIADLLPDIRDRLAGQAGDQFLPDNQSLLIGKGREDFVGFVRGGVLFCLGGYSSEENRREGARLLSTDQ